MATRCDTCEYHEDRGLLISSHGARIASVEVEVRHMNEAQTALIGRFDRAATANEKVLKDICADIKVLKVRSTPKAGAAAAEEEVERVFENQPVGYLNTMLKKVFTNPVFWALIGWALIKIFLFGEYPSFSSKTRPYMEPIMKTQIQLSEQHRIMHDAGIAHLHDATGNPNEVVTEGKMPNTQLKAVEK